LIDSSSQAITIAGINVFQDVPEDSLPDATTVARSVASSVPIDSLPSGSSSSSPTGIVSMNNDSSDDDDEADEKEEEATIHHECHICKRPSFRPIPQPPSYLTPVPSMTSGLAISDESKVLISPSPLYPNTPLQCENELKELFKPSPPIVVHPKHSSSSSSSTSSASSLLSLLPASSREMPAGLRRARFGDDNNDDAKKEKSNGNGESKDKYNEGLIESGDPRWYEHVPSSFMDALLPPSWPLLHHMLQPEAPHGIESKTCQCNWQTFFAGKYPSSCTVLLNLHIRRLNIIGAPIGTFGHGIFHPIHEYANSDELGMRPLTVRAILGSSSLHVLSSTLLAFLITECHPVLCCANHHNLLVIIRRTSIKR
jgi:hypothetical protein